MSDDVGVQKVTDIEVTFSRADLSKAEPKFNTELYCRVLRLPYKLTMKYFDGAFNFKALVNSEERGKASVLI